MKPAIFFRSQNLLGIRLEVSHFTNVNKANIMSHLFSDISLTGIEAPVAASASAIKPTNTETQTPFDQLFLDSTLLIRGPKTGLDVPLASKDSATTQPDAVLGGEASTTTNVAFFEMLNPPLVPLPIQSISNPWVRLPISTELNVITQITPDSPTSDSALVDFAKSQGFDEEAIALIFAIPPKTGTTKDHSTNTDVLGQTNITPILLQGLSMPPSMTQTMELSTNQQIQDVPSYLNLLSTGDAIPQGAGPIATISTPIHISDFSKNLEAITSHTIQLKIDAAEDSGVQLSQRLCIAIGHSLIKEMEQGRWQVQFQITPEKLGPVDVHLQLHDHKLHAQFYTSNAYTQTLLQESMHKLRETVENSGIELANAWVHGGEKHHHRENPAHDQSNTTKTQTILNPNEAPKEDMKPLIPLDARNNKNPSKRVVDLFI